MTKLEHLDPKLKNAVTSAYKLGVMEGESHNKKLLNLLQTTNSNLWDELLRLDREEPLEGICISFDMAENIIKALRSGHRRIKYANMLRHQLNKADRKIHFLLEELEEQAKS